MTQPPPRTRPAPQLSQTTTDTKTAAENGALLPAPADRTRRLSPRVLYENPDITRAAGILTDDEQARRDRIAKAAAWYTQQGLLVTPTHFPIVKARPASQSDPGHLGLNSDGKWFQLGWTKPSDPGDEADPLKWVLKLSKEFATDAYQSQQGYSLPDTAVAGKNPVMTGYLRDPDCRAETPEQAENLWQHAPWNIGVITGRQTGLFVLDVDVRSGGLESISAVEKILTAFNSTLPEQSQCHLSGTYSYYTSGLHPFQPLEQRGFHVYFTVNKDDDHIWQMLNKIGVNALSGLEIKHKSGIVVAAPSIHASGAVYTFRDKSPVKQLTREQVETLLTAIKAVRNGADPDFFGSAFSDTSGYSPNSSAISQQRKSILDAWNSSTTGNTPAGVVNGGELTWRDAASERDDETFDGYWSRQVEYWLMTGSAARQFGPGEHHDSLRPMLGALVRLVPPSDTLAWYYHEKMTKDENWLPPLYMSLACELDESVSLPEPWYKTEMLNLRGILRHCLMGELARLTWGTSDTFKR